ncbi:MAG TPA: ATP-binding cassette domain-containing protein, partial [Gammaproteobacteria bacterium]|nr:ATP-binding cassette domain-containing protein [Gammaproteobacteria bacterium]
MGGRSEEPVIRVEGLGTEIGGYWIHQNLDLEVRRDEILAVMGASGSGKSVLLRQIAGLMEPSRGRVLVMGQDIHRISPATLQGLRRKWGILFQDGALFSAFNLFDNVAFPLREMIRYGASLDADTVNDLVWNALATVKLTPQDGYKTPGQISDGMSKRAALARALVMEPDLLLLDEPT